MEFNFTWNFLTCSVTGAVDRAGHAYPSGAPDVTSGPFFCVSASVFVSSYSCTFLFSVLCCFCVPVPFVVCMCVISILPCLWILSFLNNPFTLFLWKSVAYT